MMKVFNLQKYRLNSVKFQNSINMKKFSSFAKFNLEDGLNVQSLFTEEENMV